MAATAMICLNTHVLVRVYLGDAGALPGRRGGPIEI
jgi:hypothetical protein